MRTRLLSLPSTLFHFGARLFRKPSPDWWNVDRLRRCCASLIVLGSVVALGSASVKAQQSTAKATWGMPEPPSVAATLTYTLKLGATVVPMGAVTCTTVAAATQCSAPLTPPVAPGTYVLTAQNGWGISSSDPFTGAAPGKPVTFTITITFVIQ